MTGCLPRIEVRDLSRSYRSAVETVHATSNVTLSVYPGEFLCIHGASGSGKTTLLHLLAGLTEPESGNVRIGQHDIASLGEGERARIRREILGVVFQDHQLIDEFSAAENVALPLEMLGISTRLAIKSAEVQLEAVGLAGLGCRRPAQLSGGQRQRVGIARALIGDRQVLLADEPTGSLDSMASKGIFELIRALCDNGLSAVVCTHDARCGQYADRVLEMTDGELVEVGKGEDDRTLAGAVRRQ